MQQQLLLASAAVLGYTSHALYFRHGEHHLYGMLYAQLFFCMTVASFAWAVVYTDHSSLAAFKLALQANGTFLLSLLLSTLWYRLSPLHRLASFPGPLAWRSAKLAHSWANRHGRNFEVLDNLHSTYGEYVRIGPNELSITDPDATGAVLATSSPCTKSSWYDINPLHSILTSRGPQEHRDIRRGYEQALKEQALPDYEKGMKNCIAEFETLMQSVAQQPKGVDITHWIKMLVLDLNFHVTFSRKPTCVKSGKPPAGMNFLEDGTQFLGTLGPMPWLFILLLRLPFVRKEFDQGTNFCIGLIRDRLKNPEAGPDLIGAVINSKPRMSSNEEICFSLRGEANVLAVAPNDSVAVPVTWALYHLAAEPEHAAILRKELADIQAEHGNLDAAILRSHAKHLNAFIQECLRLHPSVAGGAPRETPAEGIRVGQRYVPGNTIIWMPPWSIMRSPKCFQRPNEFIPERWTTKPELVLRRDAWIPFYVGSYGCVGRQLAMMQLRLVLSRLVNRFDVSLAEGETGKGIMQLSKDHFNMSLAPLYLTFKERAAAIV